MTEREKMLAGQLYDPSDPELLALWHRAKDLTERPKEKGRRQPQTPASLSPLLPVRFRCRHSNVLYRICKVYLKFL